MTLVSITEFKKCIEILKEINKNQTKGNKNVSALYTTIYRALNPKRARKNAQTGEINPPIPNKLSYNEIGTQLKDCQILNSNSEPEEVKKLCTIIYEDSDSINPLNFKKIIKKLKINLFLESFIINYLSLISNYNFETKTAYQKSKLMATQEINLSKKWDDDQKAQMIALFDQELNRLIEFYKENNIDISYQ